MPRRAAPKGAERTQVTNTKPATEAMAGNARVRHELFAAEYLVDFDAPAAYRRAGYDVESDESASAAGYRLLRNPVVAELVEKGRLKRIEKIGAGADTIIGRFHLIYLKAVEADDLKIALDALKELAKHYGLYERHQLQKKYTKDDLERLRAELEAAGMSFDAVNMPKPSSN